MHKFELSLIDIVAKEDGEGGGVKYTIYHFLKEVVGTISLTHVIAQLVKRRLKRF